MATGGDSETPDPTRDGAPAPLEPAELQRLQSAFSAPRWLRDLGLAAWLLVGVAALVVGVAVLAGATAVIVEPVLAGFIVAAVAAPGVSWLHRHRVPRALGAALVLLSAVAISFAIILLVVGGITSQSDEIAAQASAAADKVNGWLRDAGLNTKGANQATDAATSATPDAISTMLHGVLETASGLASLAFGLSFAALSLFFLLKDGPSLRAAVERNMGVPHVVARTITRDVLHAIRQYFGGVTIVAVFNGAVVGLAALVLDVPLAGTIAVVTFVTAYVPYIGAFVAGTFTVVLALGAHGWGTALVMLVIFVLANGVLQQMVQPVAFGATLDLNPLVVLIVTIGAGCLFGMIGLVLAAPLTSALTHIARDLRRLSGDDASDQTAGHP
jgi:predicted PurR-regulated permease PerM